MPFVAKYSSGLVDERDPIVTSTLALVCALQGRAQDAIE